MFRLKPTTQARRLQELEKKQPLRAAGSSRGVAAYKLKGTVQERKEKAPSRPEGLALVLEFVFSFGPNLEEAKVRGQRRSSRWHRFSVFLRDGEGGFKARVNGSPRVSSKCATFLTTQENVKWHKTEERRGETDWGGCKSEEKEGKPSSLTSSPFVLELPGSAAQPCWPPCFLKVG